MDSDSKFLRSSDSLGCINCALPLSLTLIIHHLLKSFALIPSLQVSGIRGLLTGRLAASFLDKIYFKRKIIAITCTCLNTLTTRKGTSTVSSLFIYKTTQESHIITPIQQVRKMR